MTSARNETAPAPAPAGAQVWGCARHAQLGPTCCQTSEVFVTSGDRARIEAHTGLRDFFEWRAPTDPVYSDQDDDPAWRDGVFRVDGTRPILRRRPEGDCGFLGAAGCTLPLEVRPLVCRLYPYTYTERGIDGVSSGCPAEVVPPGSTILQVLDLRRDDAERWHRQLYAEISPDGRAASSCEPGAEATRCGSV